MAIDVTATDNYTELNTTDQGLVDTVVTAIKAAYAGVVATDEDQQMNVYMIIKEQNESGEVA